MIPDLPAAYVDHLTSKANYGDLEPADAMGEAGSLMGGAGVRLTLRYSGGFLSKRRIREARFRVVGSAAPLAVGSLLSQRLLGLTPDEARKITSDELASGFGGTVPSRAAQAAPLWIEALDHALGAPPPLVDDRGLLVCRCLAVGDRTIRGAIRGGASDVPAIGEACTAGTGCHTCWPDLRALLDEEMHVWAEPAPSDGAGGAGGAGGAPITRIVDALVAPLWRAQGVSLGGVSVSGDVVRLRVAEVLPGALASPIGAVAMARYLLREVVSEAVRVELEGDGAAP